MLIAIEDESYTYLNSQMELSLQFYNESSGGKEQIKHINTDASLIKQGKYHGATNVMLCIELNEKTGHIKKMERPKQPFIPTHSGFGTLEALAIFDFMNFGKQTNTAGKDPLEPLCHRCIDLWCGWKLPPEIDGPAKHTDEQRQWDCCRCAEELNEKMKKRKRIVNDLFKARNPNATRKEYPFEVKPITCPWGKNIPNPSEKDDREYDCDCLEEGELSKESENDKKPSANDKKGSKKKSEKDGGDPEAKVTAAGKLPEEKKHFEKFEPVEFKHASKTKKDDEGPQADRVMDYERSSESDGFAFEDQLDGEYY